MRLLLRDEPIAAHRVVVLVKKAMAFASTSRSSRTTRSSRRIRENSSRSVVVSPSRWPLSISAWASQRWTLLSARPISRQTSAIDLPEWRISATVSDLNSLVNLRLERLSIQTNSIGASIPRFQMSVEVGQDHMAYELRVGVRAGRFAGEPQYCFLRRTRVAAGTKVGHCSPDWHAHGP